jgi:hypothetical protein
MEFYGVARAGGPCLRNKRETRRYAQDGADGQGLRGRRRNGAGRARQAVACLYPPHFMRILRFDWMTGLTGVKMSMGLVSCS